MLADTGRHAFTRSGRRYPDADEVAGSIPPSPTVRLLRRALVALSLAGAIAAALRLRGRGGTPPQHGGWQPVEFPEQ